jgi:hypothetical protein
MPDRKVKIPFPTPDSPLTDGVEVAIEESTERWTDVRLADGSELRLKPTIVSAIRMIGQFDPEGNPVYAVKAGQLMLISKAPEELKRPQPGTKVH